MYYSRKCGIMLNNCNEWWLTLQWDNGTYKLYIELVKIQQGPRWRALGGDVSVGRECGHTDGWSVEEVFHSANMCSLNVSQKVSQLYILLRVQYTPVKLHWMGRLPDSLCGKCRIMAGDLVLLLWQCPKLHHYWNKLLSPLNGIFQVSVPLNPINCLLRIFEEIIPEEMKRVAFSRALFQARKVILLEWKSATSPSFKTWVTHMGGSLILERYIYQHRGRLNKFEKLWSP